MPSLCTCSAQIEGGQVLLFYRYWDNSPKLPGELRGKADDVATLAEFHRELSRSLELGGKFRIAREGFNITVGGVLSSINKYIQHCCDHWSFSGIDLSTPQARNAYFKPTPGCACAFDHKASVRVTAEITPLGITDYAPSSWSSVTSLSPAEFHKLCEQSSIPLIDVRNHYESRIGYFVNGQGDAAIRPAVRRFSQWPAYVARHVVGNADYNKPIATYCTGGIRCEKGARWMQERLAANGDGREAPVYTLDGGIVAYQEWMQQEVESGRRQPEETFFKGKNYVFDGRGAISTKNSARGPVSSCHGCTKPEDRLVECASPACHLTLVVCADCEKGAVACCEDCRDLGQDENTQGRRMCQCERMREASLWGEGGTKINTVAKKVAGRGHAESGIKGPKSRASKDMSGR